MRYHTLGRTGVRVSALAFGTMSFAGDADLETSRSMFRRCCELGVNFFDCASVYNGGHAEEFLGRFVEEARCRDQLLISGKAYFPSGKGANDRGSSRYHLIQSVEQSLRRLRTDRIDFFFLHRFDEETPLEESLRALEILVQQGKILYPAVSNFSAWQAMKALGIAECRNWMPIACLQPMYNLVKRQAEVEILPMAQSEGLGVLTYSPLGGGLLTGKYLTNPAQKGRLVQNPMYQTRYGEPHYKQTAEALSALALDMHVPPAALAVAWVAAHPAVTAPILGARNLEQLEQSLKAAEIEMTSELRMRIDGLSRTPAPATDRNEEHTAFAYQNLLVPKG